MRYPDTLGLGLHRLLVVFTLLDVLTILDNLTLLDNLTFLDNNIIIFEQNKK